MYPPEVVRGRVIAHRDGYGFLARDDGGEDVFLSAREMRGLMHGDRIACELRLSRRGGRFEARRSGTVVEVLERNLRIVVGRFFRSDGMAFVSPEHRNLPHDVVIPDGQGVEGEIVVAEIVEPPPRDRRGAGPLGRIVERLGDPERPGMAAEIALRAHGIPHAWPDDVLAESAGLPFDVPDVPGDRVDLRDLPLVTIDGPDAKDFDDAVHCAPRTGGWKLTVAIADVSHYVPPGSALDREAAVRGTSVYFPGRVVPMLPERLSNGICSLRPEVERLCLACELHVDRRGRVTRAYFRDAVMRSRARLTYEEVEGAVFNGDAPARRRLGPLVPHLEALRDVYGALRRARRRRGAVDLELGEPRVFLSPGGGVAHVETADRLVSHQLIEECMVAANVAAARRLARSRTPFLYRVHPPPDADGLRELGTFLGRAGIDFDPGEEPRPDTFAQAAERAAGRPDAEIVHLMLLRAMAKAVYQPGNVGHFGLALERYTHFTSPIRRYPDLLVHRALRGSDVPTREEVEVLGRSASAAERRAEDASRDAVSRLVCQHLRTRTGETFKGRITGVVSFGAFVRLEGLDVDGLVHVRALGGDWYRFDRAGRFLEGESTGRRYAMGDAMEVRVTGADPGERRVHLEPVEPGRVARSGRAARRDSSGGRRRGRRR
ncbi:MAG: ribonuclease R [Immundisolibacterales bacterium]|nr:ribonuclease R [Immundisolibacterales bacterium]